MVHLRGVRMTQSEWQGTVTTESAPQISVLNSPIHSEAIVLFINMLLLATRWMMNSRVMTYLICCHIIQPVRRSGPQESTNLSLSGDGQDLHYTIIVIVMTFWYVFWNGLNFFELFKLSFSFGIDHDPPCYYDHMTYIFLFLYFILHTRIWPREVIIVLWSFWLWSTTLRTHPHPHFHLSPPQPHHPYTPRLCWSTTAPPGEGYHPAAKYGPREDPVST